ncbi:hypothetical protein N658DRAFT_494398 [Parathielavia hyrcaniae]|uniref:Uncharacterized protein n=1 Tax=Parathielavia hyrcaniae TaxID=113614 RepID=A0AAN6T3N9_9PEZI|nr:hypothetical protein N658DRAFT_494398 [Parathielavia hyrcaniae]
MGGTTTTFESPVPAPNSPSITPRPPLYLSFSSGRSSTGTPPLDLCTTIYRY